MTGSNESKDTVPRGSRRLLSRGLTTVLVATLALFAGEPRLRAVEPQQGHAADDAAVRRGARDRVARPDARRHAGRHRPLGRRRAVALRRDPHASTRPATTRGSCRRSASRFSRPIAAGSLNGFLIGRMRLNPIVATLGTNALLYGAVLWYTAGIPTHDHRPPGEARRRALARHPDSGVLRRRHDGRRHGGGQADAGGSSLRGRRRERDRRPHRRAPGEAPPDRRLRLGAAPLLPRGRAARRHRQPADGATRATTTSCRPSRPSCSAAPRCSAVAATSSRPRSPRSSCRNSTSSCSRSA